MFDYKLLSALAAVIEQAGFERAAQVLGLSQSAISQRIKLLEARVGQPVLVRANPPSPTDVGRRLLNHVQQVRLLERDLQSQVPALDEEGMPERLRIALNADSLATWWAAAAGEFCADQQVLLDLVVEDQEVGLKRMRAGEVAACLCGSERPVAGARR
ncbi:ArgP/LysG family DNA-binding transcriptional regulator, partial [Pseudomonas donghuensis]|uniref:ArgP/LysG family DNA-binding transcriptional regulator n=1 Tax=Pseudomonas donghuensis TaxID=1163398 RepID=UPI00029ADB13